MALNASSYGSLTGVAAYVLTHTEAGEFPNDATTTAPSVTQVESFLDGRSAILNGWLAQAGYVTPVTNANAVLILSQYANLGAAGLVELTMQAAGSDDTDQNRRENKFLAEFNRAEAFIKGGALVALGVVTTGTPGPFDGLFFGGQTAGGQRLRPIFKRRSFNNDPVAESPSGRESDYSGDP